ncbi:MAG: phosphoenolpyruvate carboxylase [Armatimonadetes bacterium]|nr:phosphoenolpyruvate carboxylase [Armatimonadota bacterium]
MSEYISGRKIPATMATQHPDNAWPPFWKGDSDGFISAYEEVNECYISYGELGCEEYMWDWEGKFVDEAVVDRLFSEHFNFFLQHNLGRDVFLTFRLPNIWLERGYRLARAYMSILTAEELANDLKLFLPPLFEVILPMCDDAQKMIYLQESFERATELERQMFGNSRPAYRLQIIPLIETPELLLDCRLLLKDYQRLHREKFGDDPPYIRTFIARSDPALNSGLVTAVLAAKAALCEFADFEEETGIPIHPIIGVGCLPFRGGLSPYTVDDFLHEYEGMRTVTIQSAFRYDHPKSAVVKAIRDLNLGLKLRSARKPRWGEGDKQKVQRLMQIFSSAYQEVVEGLAELVNDLAGLIPRRRERMLHIGLFGYPRGLRGKTLPRAIPFTGAFYSLGVPPEFLGTGRGLVQAEKEGLLDTLFKYYRNLTLDLKRAGRYLCHENVAILASASPQWSQVKDDIELTSKILNLETGPSETGHFLHRNLTSSILHLWRSGDDQARLLRYIVEAGQIRRSLG